MKISVKLKKYIEIKEDKAFQNDQLNMESKHIPKLQSIKDNHDVQQLWIRSKQNH